MATLTVLPNRTVSVKVPGTTANLGPAFDVAGIALSCVISVEVSAASAFALEITGIGADAAELRNPASNMVLIGCDRMLTELGLAEAQRPPLRWRIHSDVPMKAGCGSSSAAVVAGLAAGLALCGQPIDLNFLLDRAAVVEGHPDNAAPAIFGGMQIVYRANGGALRAMRVPLPDTLRLVVFSPAANMKESTTAVRGVVPKTLPMADVIHNLGRTALLVASLATGNPEHLRQCVGEKFHEDVRAPAYPHFKASVAAAVAAGADHAFLSGAGPSVGTLLLPARREDAAAFESRCARVAAAMQEAAAAAGVAGASRILAVRDAAVEVVAKDS